MNRRSYPTQYAGVNFRSRLEARWAVFFDLAGWSWEYEPTDLVGWIPDFRLGDTVLVEVKPIRWSGNENIRHQQASVKKVASLIECGQFTDDDPTEILVLGDGPYRSRLDDWCLGQFVLELCQCQPDEAMLHLGYDGHVLDFRADCGSFQFRMGGEYDGDHHLHGKTIDDDLPERIWREAGNRVQWRAVKPEIVEEAAVEDKPDYEMAVKLLSLSYREALEEAERWHYSVSAEWVDWIYENHPGALS